jgi:predicted PurR-regulated permease PerM
MKPFLFTKRKVNEEEDTTSMPLESLQETSWREERQNSKWKRRRDIPIAILAWIAVVAIILWAAGHVIRSLLLLAIAALLAFALAPAVKFLQRVMPRFLAIIIVYLVVFSAFGFLVYLVIDTSIIQVGLLAKEVRFLLTPANNAQLTPFESILRTFGISQEQIASARQQIVSQLGGFAGSVLPLFTRLLDFLLDIVVVAVVSIYLLIDGSRVTNWLRNNVPVQLRGRVRFLLATLERIVGGYIRGQLLLSTMVGLLVGIGMALFHVPYAVLLGVLAFILEFVPILGTIVSGAICVLIALTQGWLIALGVLVYFVGVHVLEGDIIGPRIVGKAVGLHPVVSLAALIAGAELFGIIGALFASLVAGILQALIVSFWKEWRATHPEQFEENKDTATGKIEENAADRQLDTSKPVGP